MTIPLDIGITEGLTCGRDDGSTVTDRLPGAVRVHRHAEQVVIDVSGKLIEDKEAEMRSSWRTSEVTAAQDSFKATASRRRALSAFSLIFSPSWMSMARRVLPSRLELNRPAGSFSEAPLKKVNFTTLL